MLKLILNKLFPQPAPAPQLAKSVDRVLASFNQTIADLEEVQREQRANADAAEQDRLDAEARRDAHDAESRRARAVADQIKNLILV